MHRVVRGAIQQLRDVNGNEIVHGRQLPVGQPLESSERRFDPTLGAHDVADDLLALLGPEVVEGSNLSLSVRENGDDAIADIVRTGLQDDSVSGGHIRIEFRREADGWFPVNAYRRTQCARGGEAGQWTSGLCP